MILLTPVAVPGGVSAVVSLTPMLIFGGLLAVVLLIAVVVSAVIPVPVRDVVFELISRMPPRSGHSGGLGFRTAPG